MWEDVKVLHCGAPLRCAALFMNENVCRTDMGRDDARRREGERDQSTNEVEKRFQ